MTGDACAMLTAGLMTSVGLNWSASCAAIRAGVTNPTETRFLGGDGSWMIGHQVPWERRCVGRSRLAAMVGRCIEECLSGYGTVEQPLPLVLCVAEPERPGRFQGLDRTLIDRVAKHLGMSFDRGRSRVVAAGRFGIAVALLHARKLLEEPGINHVIIAAADSLLVGETLAALRADSRLLAPDNSNGFIPGEAAGALLIGRRPREGQVLVCDGIGISRERATIASAIPLRGDGLAEAFRGALGEADCQMHDIDYLMTDNSGERYYFKESSLATMKTLRSRKEALDVWHPADCIGEVGAAIGTVLLGVVLAATRKHYAPGTRVLVHVGNDTGDRAAVVLRSARVG